jgi:putative membrane protein
MLAVTDLPALNATLNAIAALFLTAGYIFIRRRDIARHRLCMISAFITSGLFLTSYVIYHAQVGSKPFPYDGPLRVLYFAILIPHILLAIAIVPMALITLSRGLKMRVPQHRAIARWTLPLWLYVSVTGVIVYLMLYQL